MSKEPPKYPSNVECKLDLHDYQIGELKDTYATTTKVLQELAVSITEIRMVLQGQDIINKRLDKVEGKQESNPLATKIEELEASHNKFKGMVKVFGIIFAVILAFGPVYFDHISKSDINERHANIEMRMLDYMKTNGVSR